MKSKYCIVDSSTAMSRNPSTSDHGKWQGLPLVHVQCLLQWHSLRLLPYRALLQRLANLHLALYLKCPEFLSCWFASTRVHVLPSPSISVHAWGFFISCQSSQVNPEDMQVTAIHTPNSCFKIKCSSNELINTARAASALIPEPAQPHNHLKNFGTRYNGRHI